MPDTQSRDREGAGEPARDGSERRFPGTQNARATPRLSIRMTRPVPISSRLPVYGSWVRGDKRRSVDRHHNRPARRSGVRVPGALIWPQGPRCLKLQDRSGAQAAGKKGE
jgi:hypothetical protein